MCHPAIPSASSSTKKRRGGTVTFDARKGTASWESSGILHKVDSTFFLKNRQSTLVNSFFNSLTTARKLIQPRLSKMGHEPTTTQTAAHGSILPSRITLSTTIQEWGRPVRDDNVNL